MGPIWQAQLGQSLVMLIGPSWEPNLLPYWAPNLGPIRETRCLPQCSNYHTSRVGRGPPNSLNGPLLLENLGVQWGPPSAPLLVRIQRGPIRLWPPSKLVERIMTATVNLWKSKGFGLPIDVGLRIWPPYEKIHNKTWKRSMTKKKVVRNVGRINEHFFGKNAERFLETTLKNVAAHIDVGYGFGLRKKLRINIIILGE